VPGGARPLAGNAPRHRGAGLRLVPDDFHDGLLGGGPARPGVPAGGIGHHRARAAAGGGARGARLGRSLLPARGVEWEAGAAGWRVCAQLRPAATQWLAVDCGWRAERQAVSEVVPRERAPPPQTPTCPSLGCFR
jgi:hypothetical protein